jgi:hypothetical protein
MVDLTISVLNPAFITFPAAGVTCILTSEEQVPFITPNAPAEAGQTKIATLTLTAGNGGTLTMGPDPAQQAYVKGFSASANFVAAPGASFALVTLANLFGGIGQLNWDLNFLTYSAQTAGAAMLNMVFDPVLVGNGPGVGPNLTVPAVANVAWNLNMWGYEI